MFVSKKSTLGKALSVEIEINSCLKALTLVDAQSDEEKTAIVELTEILQSAHSIVVEYLKKNGAQPTQSTHGIKRHSVSWQTLHDMLDSLEDCFEAPRGDTWPIEFQQLMNQVSYYAEDCIEEIEDFV